MNAPVLWSMGFDPRLRDGGDMTLAVVFTALYCFDPRLRDGGDSTLSSFALSISLFRSTPP